MSKNNTQVKVKITNLPADMQPIAAQSKSGYHPIGGGSPLKS